MRGGLAFTVVEPLTEQEIRAAFVNCSKGAAKRLHVPRDLAGQPWDDLDFLGWRDPQAPTSPRSPGRASRAVADPLPDWLGPVLADVFEVPSHQAFRGALVMAHDRGEQRPMLIG